VPAIEVRRLAFADLPAMSVEAARAVAADELRASSDGDLYR
jgi:hypothetical protein